MILRALETVSGFSAKSLSCFILVFVHPFIHVSNTYSTLYYSVILLQIFRILKTIEIQ